MRQQDIEAGRSALVDCTAKKSGIAIAVGCKLPGAAMRRGQERAEGLAILGRSGVQTDAAGKPESDDDGT
tara:strand:+ start:1048 stop:1257 length:210 start_codon:yes stop_codon:yes gene_type:complete